MKPFEGFPLKMEFTPLPSIFFSQLLPYIDDVAELKTTLHILATLYRKEGYPRFVSFKELADNSDLMASLRSETETAGETLHRALKMAVERGGILHLELERDGQMQDIYLLNNQAERQTARKIAHGELELKGLKPMNRNQAQPKETPNIFTVYEENIGMLTPMIADELKEADKLYPNTWIVEAIREAVSLNKRNWRYITRILENWQTEGKSHGTHRRQSKKEDPDKFIKGRYGHMVQR
jgi:DnaD/phage-associated family protein